LGRDKGPGSGSIAAGVSFRAQLEMVAGYRDSPLFKMAAGMGDTVFTPFYDVLAARGVEINFFSRVAGVTPAADGTIAEIDILVQALTLGGAPYRPFVRVGNLDCWPNQPEWTQLENGQTLQAAGVDFESSFCDVSVGPAKPLIAGVDFDIAILAMPPQALERVVQPLVPASAPWRTALDAAVSVGTQSLQLWMQPDLAGLGWTYGPTVLTAYAEPLDSWGDMSQVLVREAWTGPNPPRSIAYFCGCLPAPLGLPIGPKEMKDVAVAAATGWLGGNIQTLWPNATPNPASGLPAVSRYDVANFDISDTYVQTPAGGNVASRFGPGATAGFSNLYVVGDWTKTRFSGGCFESAIESAMLAARAISGFPQAIKTS
ncbi:MAG: FAD-dependent oxidoreductase, partial [Caulobacteraceae bacterium]|nr:FAD-dependent oxidoreductase [Caulobacteraceae bacterium]